MDGKYFLCMEYLVEHRLMNLNVNCLDFSTWKIAFKLHFSLNKWMVLWIMVYFLHNLNLIKPAISQMLAPCIRRAASPSSWSCPPTSPSHSPAAACPGSPAASSQAVHRYKDSLMYWFFLLRILWKLPRNFVDLTWHRRYRTRGTAPRSRARPAWPRRARGWRRPWPGRRRGQARSCGWSWRISRSRLCTQPGYGTMTKGFYTYTKCFKQTMKRRTIH